MLRDLSEPRPVLTPTPQIAQQQAGAYTQPQPHHHHHHHHLHQAPQAGPFQPHTQVRIGGAQWPITGTPFGQQFQPPTIGIAPGIQPLNLPPGYTPQQFAQHQRQWLATMNAQMGQHRMDNLVNQNQRDRAGAQESQTAGPRGTQHGTNTPGGTASPLQPDATRTIVREGVGSNGQHWRITVNESILSTSQRQARTSSPFSMADAQGPWRPPGGTPQPRSVVNGGQLSGSDLQNILRTADTNQATRTITDAMRRNASTPSLSNLASAQANRPVPPGVTTPSFMAHAARSAAGTPDSFRALGIGRNNTTSQPQTYTPSGTPEVYILSSPTGPRALLLNSNSENYFTPQTRAGVQIPGLQNPLGTAIPRYWGGNSFPNMYQPTPTQVNHTHRSPVGADPSQVNTPQQQQQPQNGLAHPPQGQAQPGHAVARPDNAQVEAVRIANLWPAVWGLIRLSLFLFIWWYTSPTASWSRLIIVISIAITFFLANAGLLAPLTGHVWVPVRQHLENLIPLADHQHRDARAVRANNAAGGDANAGNPGGPQRDPDPANTAARLVHQRRERNANWLANQVRRLERAGILFLASIAPGVAERHIAHLEAEARAERQRRQAEEAAAAEAAAARERTENAPEGAEQVQDGTASSTAVEQQNQAGGAEGDGVRARVPHTEGQPIAT